MTSLADTIVSTSDLAAVLGLTDRRVRQLREDGTLPEAGRGRFVLGAAVQAYNGRLREQAAGRQGADEDAPDLTDERARLAKAQADAQEMKNAQTRGELLPRGDVDAAVAAAFARVRARLVGIPAKAAPVVMTMESAAEAQAALRDAIYEALRELSETAVADLCRDDGDVVEDARPAAGSDGQPVG
jgi:phage terminase Nu1 subunit (DNA packaging protein)